jgi:choline dehydrogenase-like flavoprotein
MPDADATYDVLIVGGGTAGSVLASRLSEDPGARVCLVEAGGAVADPDAADPLRWPLLQGRAYDWQYRTLPQPGTAGRVHAWPRGRALGGSSLINAMAHVRGHPDDFDRWGQPGWGFADLFPYFLRSEHWTGPPSPWHATGGPIHLQQALPSHPLAEAYRAAAEGLGHAPLPDHNGARLAGPTANTLTIKDGRRQSAADAYLPAAVLARANLTLRAGTAVAALDVQGRRCLGVTLADGMRLAAGRVVLAAGAIGSPLLLLRAGIGPAAELEHLGIAVRADLPGVGRNLQDHLLSGGNLYRARRPLPPSRWQHSESLLYLPHGPGPAPGLALACVVVPVVTECFQAPPPGEAWTLMFGFTHPRSRGRLRLASADPGAPPLIDPCYLSAEADRAAYLAALDAAQAVGGSPALADWNGGELLPGPGCRTRAERLAFLERAAYTHHHPVGTCRMGHDADAVVGPDLALHGFEGLSVADASVFPSITTGPVNAAIIALAERAADLLAVRPPLTPFLPAG